MSSGLKERYIRLEVISGKNLQVPSQRIPAGIYISVNIDSRRRWKTAIKVLSSHRYAVWGDVVTLSPYASPAFSVEIRASYEADRMLGSGEVIGELRTSWDMLLNHGDEPFELSFPPIRGIHPFLTLKAGVVHTCDDLDGALFDSLVDRKISRDTDAGHARFSEYITSKMASHLDDAVKHFQLVLDQCPVGHPDRAAALTNLACTRLEGYIQKDIQDVDTTTSLFREALALRPQAHPDHALSLYNLINALNSHYSKVPIAAYIHESAQLCCRLLPFCPVGTCLRSIGLDIAVNYVTSKCNDLPIDASDECIHLRRNVLKLCPMGQRHRPKALDRLSWALRSRFTQRGSIDDLDESIQFRREAVSLCHERHSDRDVYLNNLASSLELRFNHQGKPNDLDEAISLHEEALRLRPVGHKRRHISLGNLGAVLVTRFDRRGDINDIIRAINLYHDVLTLHLPGSPSRGTTLNNFAIALKTRYDKLRFGEDLNEAIDLSRESLQLTPLDDPERHVNIFNLSSALCSRFMHTRKNEDIQEAINLCQESLAALPLLHPDRSVIYTQLQETYLSRYRILHDPSDLLLAVENFRLASRHPTQGLPWRISEAIDWARKAEVFQHESALEAYQMCFELFDSHVMTRSSIISRREAASAFRGAKSLPVDAASCAMRSGNLRQAVELLEQGRGQQWSLASRLRIPLEDLKSTSPQLAQRLSEISKRLSDTQSSAVSTDRAAADRAATEYRKVTRQWEAAVAEVRNLQGFSRFLRPPSFADLQAAARHGPVIILIASQHLCNAIIVPRSGEPHQVRFPRITLPDLENLKDDFSAAILHAARMHPEEPRKQLRVLLQMVWDEIMLPIVNVLQYKLQLCHRSRIWLCPTAAFTFIPLHAANPFRMKADRSGPEACLEDIYICSYTPTLSALIRSRQTMKMRVAPSFAAIGQSQPGAGQGTLLPAVDSELELVHELVPSNIKFNNLSGDRATQAAALNALQQNTWVHLACHGKQDREQPYNSRFAMRDKPLTLLDIMENNSPHAEFAFLSACHTAVGDEETPDEAIHLAAGLQFSGFKSVIGTLWAVNDALVKHVVEAFYEKMFGDLEVGGVMDCTKAAWALNSAAASLKKKKVPLEQRIVFVHIGV